ncbi:MAG: haloalkane dehalogenase [Actinomycetota bacterium]|nr:haloalkane dehalogenase [Actinomycetota bacterium]
MDVLRTPDERFADLPDWPYAPRYVDVNDGSGQPLRMAAVDEGPRDGEPVLLLHGEPTWSYLYRFMIPVLVDAGCRVVAPDLVGFGRSDKPASVADHSYARHVAWTAALLDGLDLRGITLVGQDWGGLIGLRLVAEQTERFARVVAANTGLPTGDQPLPPEWHAFRQWVEDAETLPIGKLVNAGSTTALSPEVVAAYDAPFPDERYKAGPRAFPQLVPRTPDDPAADANRRAWATLTRLELPFLTAFSDRDPITRPAERPLQEHMPGARGRRHATIRGAGHFLQEDRGAELARVVADFVAET